MFFVTPWRSIRTFCIVVFLAVFLCFLYKYVTFYLKTTLTCPFYCLMVTGKSSRRLKWARASVRNFQEQTYSNKFLVIVNHGSQPVLASDIQTSSNMIEHRVSKTKGTTLGDLRNLTVSFVPMGALWTTWDDDDIRSPNYMEQIEMFMKSTGKRFCMIQNRIEYNVNTHKMWVSSFSTGFLWFTVRKSSDPDEQYQYASKDTNEDGVIKEQILQKGPTYYALFNNDPMLYVRMIHEDNTSMFVDRQQTGPKEKYALGKRMYVERTCTTDEAEMTLRRVRHFYPEYNIQPQPQPQPQET